MRLVLICALLLKIAQCSPTSVLSKTINVCGTEQELALEARGEAASYTLVLDPQVDRPNSLCRLRVTAPKTHAVYMQFVDEDLDSTENRTDNKIKGPSCTMSIYLPDNTKAPYWTGNPCSGEKMPDIDLLTRDFKILWETPENDTTPIKQKTFILTAVGSGPFCKDPFQHTCMRIGRIPMLCISDHLLCDGIQNCPKSSTNSDEDEKLCKTARNAWEKIFVELVKRYRPQPGDGKWLKVNMSDAADAWLDWQLVKRNTTTKPEVINETHSATESISAMLNKYGPWGYLMMGLLICGTVLFFCGLWECCCKRPKPDVDPPPTTSPTTVLIMSCERGTSSNPLPPNYDELDLPPSYTTLFPVEQPSSSSPTQNEDDAKDSDVGDSSSEDSNQAGSSGGSAETDGGNVASTSQEHNLTSSDSG
ncbi:hypothetical protein GWI33_006091 [Rhynchophorus ferrugineus]|uniref:CUB domain-containing protein n=1 Tax=Rhynchophorus ferrugineus TaxID=354439 RepID=A0A834IL03_RHYFE|nr:hypothetical protein GWI33_006091 [Rhynchophorus ferrugineus]